jgi:hypothetical protein
LFFGIAGHGTVTPEEEEEEEEEEERRRRRRRGAAKEDAPRTHLALGTDAAQP